MGERVFYCERKHQCEWQCFALHRGLGWGPISDHTSEWREWHAKMCGGRLIEFAEPATPDPRDAALAAKDEEIGRLRGAITAALSHIDYLRDVWGDEAITRNVADVLRVALQPREAPDAG